MNLFPRGIDFRTPSDAVLAHEQRADEMYLTEKMKAH